MFKEQQKILELFRLNPFAELTLQEIMHSLGKKSYNWTYLAIQKLAKEDFLITRKIGKTIVARINLESEDTITELIYLERRFARKTEQNRISGINTKQETKKTKEIQEIKKITPFFILLENEKEKIIIVDKKTNIKFSGSRILSKEEFVELLTAPNNNAVKQLAKDHAIMHGAEAYYELLLEAYRHGLR